MPPPLADVPLAKEDWKRRRRLHQDETALRLLTDEILNEEWRTMTWRKRGTQCRAYRRRTKTVARAQALVDSGQASVAQARFAQNGGYTMHGSREASEAANLAAILKSNNAKSATRLEAKKASVTGCSVAGCPLEKCQLLCLIDYDHRDGVIKRGLISQMNGSEAEEEASKNRSKMQMASL